MEKVEKNDFGEVQVEISEDDMEAYITLTPEKLDQVFQMDELKILLKAAGVEYGVLEDVLQKAVSEKRYYEQFTVARGEEPVDGQPRGVGDDLAGGGGGAQGMLSQNPAVGGAELSHQLLFVIMGDQGDIHVIRSSLLWIQIRIRGIRCPMMRRAIFS